MRRRAGLLTAGIVVAVVMSPVAASAHGGKSHAITADVAPTVTVYVFVLQNDSVLFKVTPPPPPPPPPLVPDADDPELPAPTNNILAGTVF